MAANSKTIKRRIRSVGNTRKITKAMELVAASKMRRAMTNVHNTRPFATLAWDTVSAVTQAIGEGATHTLLTENEVAEKTLVILFTSDRGLAGAFNANILKETVKQIKEIEGPVEAIAIGKKGNVVLTRNDVPIIASFEGLTNKPIFKDILPITKLVLDEYEKGSYKKVFIAYTDFKSALSQVPNWLELLPFGTPDPELGKADNNPQDPSTTLNNQPTEYKFEPSPQACLDRMLPRLIETTIYQALLESAASEHAARMMAMRNASDNAGDMLQELKMTYNRIRQAGITQEISEISAGKAALE